MDALLIAGWLAGRRDAIPIHDAASVSLVRERVRALGRAAGLPVTVIESLAIVASELGHNHLVHARSGEIAVAPIERGGVAGLEIVAADRGRGIADPARALAGAPRSSRSLGTGVSGVLRMADEVDIDVRLGEGTCVWARKFAAAVPKARQVAIFGRPCEGEVVSGDGAVFSRHAGRLRVAVADGLGHGPLAREAALAAMKVVRERAAGDPLAVIEAADGALQATRGAVMTVATLDDAGELEQAAVGNVCTRVFAPKTSRTLTGSAFVLGAPGRTRPRINVERVQLGRSEVVALYTDGLSSRVTLAEEPALLHEPAIVIAQRLVERFGRTNDDCLVAVCR